MKGFLIKFAILVNSLVFSAVAFAVPHPSSLLAQMQEASQTLNYEFSYITINRGTIDSMRYRHAVVNQTPLVQLLQLDGPENQVLRKGKQIGYFFEQGSGPFSINGDYIVDGLPAIVFTDLTQLAKLYDFLAVGRLRVADSTCLGVRIIPKDGLRYSYIVWVDEQSKLPLQIELLDRNSEMLEQFRVVSYLIGEQVKTTMQEVSKLNFPPLIGQETGSAANVTFDWRSDWMPSGFKEINRSRQQLPDSTTTFVDTLLFSDGLFTFSINVLPLNRESQSQHFQHGRKTIHTESRLGYEIVVIGEIPQNTARRVASNVVFTGTK